MTKKIAIEAVKMWQKELGEPLSHRQKVLNNEAERLNRLEQQNKPKCPICSSTNIQKISITKRAVKTAFFGALGAIDDAGKTYQCKNCGSKF